MHHRPLQQFAEQRSKSSSDSTQSSKQIQEPKRSPERRRWPMLAVIVTLLFLLGIVFSKVDAAGPWGYQMQHGRWLGACPNYRDFSTRTHAPYSDGELRLPFQRPAELCRTFRSEIVDQVVLDMKERLVDKDLAQLFENCFPNTLDTTVKWTVGGSNPQSFIVTGDINAEWLRDSTNQLSPYMPLVHKDIQLKKLMLGAINTQANYIIQSPYCNAFQPPSLSTLEPSSNDQHDNVHPVYDASVVFECKYELDSLAAFISLSWQYYNATGDHSFMKARWLKAVRNVLRVIDEQSEGSFNQHGFYQRPKYTFQRNTNIGTETLSLSGGGNPVASNTSLIRSAFRPSDDATILQFLIPANAFMSVELGHLATLLQAAGDKTMARDAQNRSKDLKDAIWKHGVVDHAQYGRVFAYETDGYGSHIIMDDANLPSLLSLPHLGFLNADDPVYQNTRRMVLAKVGNPYFLNGPAMSGIGGPHIGAQHAWPMSSLIRILTSDDDEEIKRTLELVKMSTAKLGLIHESVNVRLASDYTRSNTHFMS